MSDGVQERRVETDPDAPATARMKMIRMRRDLLDITISRRRDFAVLRRTTTPDKRLCRRAPIRSFQIPVSGPETWEGARG